MLTIRKTVHSLFGFTKNSEDLKPTHRCRIIPSNLTGLLLIAGDQPALKDIAPPDQELEDASLRGLHEPDHNNISMCTEPLGSESCDGEMVQEVSAAVGEWGWGNKRQRQREETEIMKRKLPPPLPWIAGRRSRFMKADRCSGRIKLTEVEEIERRPEMFRAFRENGRLRLHLVGGRDKGERDKPEAEELPAEVMAMTCQEEVSLEEGENDMWGQKAQQQRFVTAA